MTNRNVRIERSDLGTLTRLGVGGQGIVYEVPSLRMQYASKLVFKEYKQHAIPGLDVSALEAMPTYLETLQFSDGMELLSLSAWPCRLVQETGAVRGFVMPAIPDEFFLNLKKASGIKREAGEFQHLLNGDSFLVRRQIPLTSRHRYELLADAARGLSVFHRHNIAVGDLSPKNLLFSLTPHVKVFFIDCDAMRFQDRSVMPQLETPEWEVRAVNPGEELGTPSSDTYKLALLALRLFAGDQSTRDTTRIPRSVNNEIRQLISVGLSRLPSARPAPSSWVQPLLHAASSASTTPPTLPQPRTITTIAAPAAGAATRQPAVVARQPNRPPRSASPSLARNSSTPSYVPPSRTWWQQRSGNGKVAIAASAIAVIAIAISSLGSGNPGGSASGGSTSGGSASGIGSSGEGNLPLADPGEPTYEVSGGRESRYSSEYAAQIVKAKGKGYALGVLFNATGRSDLRRPETSCLQISGDDGRDYVALPSDMKLSVERSRNYIGRLTFPALISGSYSFNYSCEDDYSLASLGHVSIPSLGVSRYSSDYYAVVISTGSSIVRFASHGPSDLRHPESSCLIGDGNEVYPRVSFDFKASKYSKTYVGTMMFNSVPSEASFLYSCAGDYTTVPLGG